MERIVETFRVKDGTGAIHTVNKWQGSISTSDMSGTSSIPGLPSYRLDTNAALNVRDAATFTHYATQEVYTRITR